MNIGPSIYNHQSKKQMFFDILNDSKINCIIKVVSLNVITHINELSLINYDCVVYDLLDVGCKIDNPSNEIENYIKNGGNILVTHDHQYFGLANVLGLKLVNSDVMRMYNKALNVLTDHGIWKSYYSLDNYENTVMNVNTHNPQHIISNNNDTKQLIHSYDNNNYLYLSVRHLGMGKAVFWNTGHCPELIDDEKKLYLNIMAWILDLKINLS